MRKVLTGFSAVVLMASCSTSSKFFGSDKKTENNSMAAWAPAASAEKQMPQTTISPVGSKTDKRMERIERTIASAEITEVSAVNANLVPTNRPASDLQKKYAVMLNVMPASISESIVETMDDWYGTRYRYGGTSKSGIDCSAFTREMYRGAFGMELPRTAREQYGRMRKVSTAEMREGDLVFFNTTGGVSHVGLYLGNNKFVHASTSRGVVISDLYETYYISRFIGAGRMDNSGNAFAQNVPSRIANN